MGNSTQIGQPVKCSLPLKKKVDRSRRSIQKLISILGTVIDRFITGEGFNGPTIEAEVFAVLPHLLHSLGTSSQTICDLSKTSGFHTRDCMGIARSVTELAINICYILSYPEAADRASRHARLLTHTRRRRSSTI